MNRRQLKAAMKAQRQALKASQRALREKVAALPQVKAAKRRRQVRRGLTLAALLVLLFFIRCECDPTPPPLADVVDAGAFEIEKPVVKPPPSKAVKPGSMKGTVKLAPRGDFGPVDRSAPGWLEAFRLQVAARSPRLAECFHGTERPGALRWAAAVNPESGAVADQTFEPVGVTVDLTAEQRTCLSNVLASPPYRMKEITSSGQALPNRVSLVIEF